MKIFRHTPGTTTPAGFIGILSMMIRREPRLVDTRCHAVCYEDLCHALSRFEGVTHDDCAELIKLLREFKGEDFLIESQNCSCPVMMIGEHFQTSTSAAIKEGVDAVKNSEPWIMKKAACE